MKESKEQKVYTELCIQEELEGINNKIISSSYSE